MNFLKLLKRIAYINIILALYNKLVGFLAVSSNLLKTGNSQVFNWEYGKVAYKKIGEGHPCVLLHDLSAYSCGFEWDRIVSKLSTTNTVFVPDLPGCGRSDKPSITYSNYLYIKFLNSFLKECVKEPCTIICSRKSSSFAILAASINADLIKHIVLINPVHPTGLDQSLSFKEHLVKNLLELPVIGTTMYNHFVSKERIGEQLAIDNPLLSDEEKTLFTAIAHEATHLNLRYARRYYQAIRYNYCVLPVKQVLPKLSVPVDIISGESDKLVSDCHAYKDILPSVNCFLMEGTTYYPHMENADLFAQLISE